MCTFVDQRIQGAPLCGSRGARAVRALEVGQRLPGAPVHSAHAIRNAPILPCSTLCWLPTPRTPVPRATHPPPSLSLRPPAFLTPRNRPTRNDGDAKIEEGAFDDNAGHWLLLVRRPQRGGVALPAPPWRSGTTGDEGRSRVPRGPARTLVLWLTWPAPRLGSTSGWRGLGVPLVGTVAGQRRRVNSSLERPGSDSVPRETVRHAFWVSLSNLAP